MKKEIQDEIAKDHFRVAIFGSARIKKDDETYKEVFEFAKKIAENKMDIVTGGGPGIMEAANAGHRAGDTSDNTDSIGLTIRLPWEASANKHLDIQHHFDKFSDRLDTFMQLSNVMVIMPGGIGTCLELFYSWQLTQVKHICNIPIIVCGDMWAQLIQWIEKYPLKRGLISPGDMKNVHTAKDPNHAMKVILKAKELYEKLGDDYCVNWKKYKIN